MEYIICIKKEKQNQKLLLQAIIIKKKYAKCELMKYKVMNI